jgi:4-aminobutyrate aminotransferase/(S)-3-amino-2-methylpropionate transaminase
MDDDFPVFWQSARGATVVDVDGNRYLDLTSAFGVSSFGHSAYAIGRAIQRQTDKMWHGMGDVHPNAVKVELLEALKAVTPGRLSQSILSNSGAEAVESALKTARLATGKPGVIAFEGAYHGLSYGTLTVTDREVSKAPFENQVPNWAIHSPFPDTLRGITEERCLDALERFLHSNYATPVGPIGAILVEPIQGRGGVRIPKPAFLKGLRHLAKQFNLVLIADEIFTGFGRTGCNFAVEHAEVVPDLLCLGKALTNGFPLSACIGTSDVMSAWPESDGEAIHTRTFLGNPLGCAMALASIKELTQKHLARRAWQLGIFFKRKLQRAIGDHPHVAEVRGCGLMIGIELVQDRQSLNPNAELATRVVKESLMHGLIVLSGGEHRNVLTLTPPLTITKRELSRATAILVEIINQQKPPASQPKALVGAAV